MEHKVDLAAEFLHALLKHHFEVFNACGVGRNDWCIEFLRELVELAHTQGHRRVAERDGSTFFNSLFSHFPSNGFRVQSAEDDAALAFQQIVCHLFLLLKILNCGTKLQTLCRLSKRFARKPVACRPPCLFLLAFQRAEKGIGFTPLPEGDSGNKNDATALPQQDAVRLLQDAAQSVFLPCASFFLTKERKSCTKIACLFLPILLHLYHQTTI